jgi:hypothetical protein
VSLETCSEHGVQSIWDGAHVDNFDVVFDRPWNVIFKVSCIALWQDDFGYTGPVCAQHLFFDAAYGCHIAPQSDFARHGKARIKWHT